VGFTRAELETFAGAYVPDLLAPVTRLLFVGINPGLWTAAVQAHFARRGNRFYPALHRAGILDRTVDASSGYRADDLAHLHERGIGITNLVRRASARADDLTPDELVAGRARLEALVAQVRPAVVAVLGITAYRTAFGHRAARAGRQPVDLHGAQLWVLPNPSGLNAHSQLPDLAAAYRQAAVAAGIVAADGARG
jgi:TDG/mug DNA glycosylase family protein